MALNFMVEVDDTRYMRVNGKEMIHPTTGEETYRLGFMLCLKTYVQSDGGARAPYINTFFKDEDEALQFLDRMCGGINEVIDMADAAKDDAVLED